MKAKIIFALALSLAGANLALAQTSSTTPKQPVFPVAALGGCESKEACKLYCDDESHKEACFAFAQANGLMRKDEVEKARAFLKARVASSTPALKRMASTTIDRILAEKGGPGGCTTREACKAYCDDPANATTCLAFAKTHNLMTATQIEHAKKLHAQVGPGGCKGEACKAYCADKSHEQLCLEFARQNGFISGDEAAKRLEKMRLASTTRPAIKPERPATTTNFRPTDKPLERPRIASTTNQKPPMGAPGARAHKPLPPSATSKDTKPDGSNIDYSKPPYHCTPAQAEEGACDPEQLPGYVPPEGSEQGGSIWLGILHFFGFR